ncbi:MAG: DsbA family protein [Burkholderiales bacterium]|nr:DsbA family protein [Burkholderiales bacterium]
MKTLEFWFDPVSPYAYLAFEQLPQALEGCSYVVAYRPVLFAGLLGHWGQKGPAEIEPKRAWTFRQVAWAAHRLGIEIATPAQHPFNPLPLLRLALASAPAGELPNRRACELILRHVWRGAGADARDPARLQALHDAVVPLRDPASDAVKAELRAHTEVAIERGVFGVPTVEVEGRLFWGLDALPMVRALLQGDPWFDGPEWDAAAVAPPGVVRTG